VGDVFGSGIWKVVRVSGGARTFSIRNDYPIDGDADHQPGRTRHYPELNRERLSAPARADTGPRIKITVFYRFLCPAFWDNPCCGQEQGLPNAGSEFKNPVGWRPKGFAAHHSRLGSNKGSLSVSCRLYFQHSVRSRDSLLLDSERPDQSMYRLFQ
jgi:hypothetical protein